MPFGHRRLADGRSGDGADARIAVLAGRQGGVVSRRQLLAREVSDDEIRHRLRTKRLHPVLRGVYAAGHADLSAKGRLWAASLAVEGAVISHRSAAVLHGLPLPPGPDVVDVIVPRSAGGRRRAWLVPHRSETLTSSDVTIRDELRVTTLGRTLLDLATVLDEAGLTRAVNEALRRHRITQRLLQHEIDAHPTHPGRKRLALLVDDRLAPARSSAEDRLVGTLRAAGITDFVVNHRPGGGDERDLHFADSALDVEIDGVQYHSTRDAIEADHERDRRSRARGIVTLRFTPRQIEDDTLAVIAEIATERARRRLR